MVIALTNYRQLPRLISAPNYRTRGSGQRSWTQGWRSQTEGESEGMTGRSLLQTRQRKLFPAPQKPASPYSFISAAFTSHAAFFGTFLGSKKVPSSSSFSSPRLPVLTPDTPSARARSARADSGRCRTWPCPGSAPDSCRIPRGARRGYRPKSPG